LAGLNSIPVEVVSLKDPLVLKRFESRFDPIDGEGQNIVFVTSKMRKETQKLLFNFGKIEGRQLP
jgi:hypothetical protein